MKLLQITISLFLNFFSLSFFITSCNGKVADISVNAYFPQDLADQIQPDTKRNEYNFVVGESIGWYSPIIRYHMDGKKCFMVIDTGCHDSLLTKKGIEKVFSGMIFSADYNYPYKYVTGQIDGLEYILEPDEFLEENALNTIDGFLGLSWLWKNNKLVEQNENVVIDYVNNKVLFNQKPVSEESVPLIYDNYFMGYKIPFIFNDKELIGYLDTGSFCTIINQRFEEEKDENGVYVVKNFSIGGVHYESIELTDGKKNMNCSERARHDFASKNFIGYPCFKDHIIQLDFKNNVFRIK